MKSASKGSQSMARAALRFGSNAVSLSFCRQFAITSSCQRRASVATRLTILHGPKGPSAVSARHGPVALAGPDQGPDGPCHAGGEGDCDQLHRFALQHFPKPVFSGGLVAAVGDLREGAPIQQPSEITIADLCNLPQLFFPTAGMRPWRQSDRHAQGVLSARRCQVARLFEV